MPFLTTLAAVLALFSPKPATLTQPTAQAAYIVPDYSTSTLRAYARQVALEEGLPVDLFDAVLRCESGYVWNARGDSGTSIGVAQFHRLDEWGISTTTALDPYASIDLMARAWQPCTDDNGVYHPDGQASRWSCYASMLPRFEGHAD